MQPSNSKKNSRKIIHVDEDENSADLPRSEEDRELSLDEIDGAISEEDPNFLSSLAEIEKDKSLTMAELILTSHEQAIMDERERLKRLGKIVRILLAIFPILPRSILLKRKLLIITNNWFLAKKITITNFFYFLRTQGIVLLLKKLKQLWQSTWTLFLAFNNFSNSLSFWRKSLLLGTFILTIFTGFFVYRSWTQGVIPKVETLFIQSFEKVADKVHTYDSATDSEPFYENLRSESNVFMIPKLVVNIKKSKNSKNNPMAAFEFIVEGWTPEAVLEFKHREVEFRDLIQRTIEEFTFDQLDSSEGKRILCQQIQKAVNSKLTTAQLKRVLIKTAIIKP